MSPLPPIIHLLAIAAGAWLGLTTMDRVAPDLPSQEPGVAEAGPRQITAADDPESFLQPGPFSTALSQIVAQLGADEEVVRIRVTFDQLSVDTTDDSDAGVGSDELSHSAPSLLAYAVGEARRGPGGETDVDAPEDFRSVEFHATPAGGVWTAVLGPRHRAPRAYEAGIPAGTVAFQVRVRPVAGS